MKRFRSFLIIILFFVEFIYSLKEEEEEEEDEGLKPNQTTQSKINNFVNKVVQENQNEILNPNNNENTPPIAQDNNLKRSESVGDQKQSQAFPVTQFEELSPAKTNAERYRHEPFFL